ncbi:MAG: ATP-binding protein [Pseudomonadota bacterium]
MGENYKVDMIDRWIRTFLLKQLTKPFVHILFGARQTGKTTLLNTLLPNASLNYNLADPEERTRLLAEPALFRRECEALPERKEPHVVLVDEAQAVPAIFDAVQTLYDQHKSRWKFVICGSSARKLRRTGANLLPGRAILYRLYPLILPERPPLGSDNPSVEKALISLGGGGSLHSTFPPADIEERLAYGELPGVVLLSEEDRKLVLRSFASLHLEEEIRREALVKDWGAFVNFLRLAARESGQMVNFAAISREVGLSQPTVKSYYQLLEDMFIGFQVPAYSKSPRKNLLSTPRFFFFDLGIRHAASGVTPDRNLVRADPGKYFEQWVGIEIWKRLHYRGEGQLHHLRTKDGAEVDFIVEFNGELIPLEVKWSRTPSLRDVTHLAYFLKENPRAKKGFVICRCPRPAKLTESIMALPWQYL